MTYSYDGDGKRIEKSGSTLYWYGMSGDVLEETNLSGVRTSEYVFFNGERIARFDPAGDVFTYFADHLGSSREVQEVAHGASTATVSYDADFYPFGRENAFTNITNPIHKFTGKERDSESGLDDFGARYYSSTIGRFMIPDPIHFQAKMLYDPQSFNLYAYVRNNPIVLTDPTGEAIELTGDEEERKKELDALKSGVGAEAGAYLYDNAVTDKNGNTTHYVGILSGGPDGKGPSFDSINSASGALSGIVNDTHTAALGIVNPGTEKEGVVIGPIPNTPGLTADFGGKLMSYIMDTTKASPGRLPGDMMSNGRPGELNSGILAFHELGHQMYQLQHPIASWFDSLTGSSRSNQQAVDLENKVRQTQHPNGPTRTEHDRQ